MRKAESANFPEFEAQMLHRWELDKTFERSLANRRDSQRFSYYDGPPFANGLPHYGHVLTLTQKDAITRYKTMRGYYVPRRNGWDTHGLPVEYEVEKQLGISGKRQIIEMGVDKFNQAARDSVFKYKGEFEAMMTRLGRWADTDNYYATLDDDYIESVWWVFSQLWKKNLVYQGFRSNPYCPRCATPLSNFEVNQNYKDDVPDPSVYVKFQLVDHPDTSFLAWTTTPWTLPANAALAVDENAEYVKVELRDDGDSWQKGEKLILAKKRLNVLDLKSAEYKILGSLKGSELVGGGYKPLYDLGEESVTAWKIYADGSVSLEDGTGILHVAPRYGETDLALGLKEDLPLIQSVDSNGLMVPGFAKVAGLQEIVGRFFKKADDHIIADLTQKGRIFAAETFTHTYPFCWRCETPLLYFAMPSWFIKVADLRDRLVANNQEVNWVPSHIKQGRFGNWLAEARDWNVSRNRFWGAPIPIWGCEAGHWTVVGGLDELKDKATNLGTELDLHRPGIDQVIVKCSQCGGEAKRVEEVFDCWFESGSMPYAQDHYPFEHKAEFELSYPADFIAEGLDQTRGWFYTLHVLATALFDKPAFKNVIVNGMVLAADGKKLSKRLRNYPDPEEIFSKYGADSLRLFFMSSPVVTGEDVRFSAEAVSDVSRNIFMTIWNVYSFFSTYAEIDNWEPLATLSWTGSSNVLDRWLVARLDEATAEMTAAADEYQISRAVRPLRELVDDLSNWYVRRSRRRFWKSEDDTDKQQAYATLYFALLRLAQLLAPWSPFLADKIWIEMVEGTSLPTSVHLSDWPKAGRVDRSLISLMAQTRQVVTDGLALRADAGIRVRQPLAKLEYSGDKLDDALEQIIADEVNVKTVVYGKGLKLDTEISHELKLEGVMRDVVRLIQAERKAAGLAVEDRIELDLGFGDDAKLVPAAVENYRDLIMTEVLATKLGEGKLDTVPKRVEGEQLYIAVRKAK